MMLNKIRHLKDKLLIRDEMAYTIGTWLLFSLIQYFLFLCDQQEQCVECTTPIIPSAFLMSYFCILFRDLAILGVTCYCLRKVVKDRRTNADLKSIADGRETHIQLYEFNSVLLSVLPY